MLTIAEPPVEAEITKAMDNMRAYYADDEQLTCVSANGITPSEKSITPQSKQCAACPKNSWGSRITPNGKRAKACTEYAALKLLVLDEPSHVLMLRVPSTSLRSFRTYEKSLSSRGYGLKSVVTFINVQPLDNYDLLTFRLVRFLNDAQLNSIKHLSMRSYSRFEKTDGYIH